MSKAISWCVVFILLVLWSFASWAFHAIAAWSLAGAAVLTGAAGASHVLRPTDWLTPLLQSELGLALDSMVSALMPAIAALQGWVPALTNGLSVTVWVVWAIGSALLILLGFVASGLTAMLRERVSMPSITPQRPPAAYLASRGL